MDKSTQAKSIESLVETHEKQQAKLSNTKLVLLNLSIDIDTYNGSEMAGLPNLISSALSENLAKVKIWITEGLAQIQVEQDQTRKEFADNIKKLTSV